MSITIRSTMKMAERRPSWEIWLSSQPAPRGGAAGEEQVHNGREGHDDPDGLQAPGQGPEGHPGDDDAQGQQRRHDGVGHHPLGVEQGHNVQDHRQELGAGVQPVDEGIAREKLAQGDISQHTPASPLMESRACSSSSTV